MSSVEPATAYFEANAHRLKANRLVDESGALKEMLFDRIAVNSRVIEAGAGTGLYTQHLFDAGHPVTAIDLSQSPLDQSRARVDGGPAEERLDVRVGEFSENRQATNIRPIRRCAVHNCLRHFSGRTAIQEITRSFSLGDAVLRRIHHLVGPGSQRRVPC